MDQDKVTFMVPPHLAEGLYAMADRRDVTPGQILRDLIARELKRSSKAKTPVRADELLVARLQRLLAWDMASAASWSDLTARIERHGCELRPAGGGLTLHDLETGRRLCKASELGFPYIRFVKKFNAAMPGHPHQMHHILTANAAKVPPNGAQNDIILIEED